MVAVPFGGRGRRAVPAGRLARIGATLSLHHALLALSLLVPAASGEQLVPVHAQQYAMGTMFDLIAYHPSRAEADRAVKEAVREILRLDDVMSHFKPDSGLSRLVRESRDGGFVPVDPSLFDVIGQSLQFSRASGGAFDITVAPLVKLWKSAREQGRVPSGGEIAAARRCVGFDAIDLRPPDRIRLRFSCMELDLGGIGKGYAVDRAMEILQRAGIRHALVNSGGSSIAAIGSAPGARGWPVELGSGTTSRRLLLRDASVSTSQQNPATLAFGGGVSGDILNPATGAPVAQAAAVSVVAPSATVSDALATTLVMLPGQEGARLLGRFPDAAAVWVSAGGELTMAGAPSRLESIQR